MLILNFNTTLRKAFSHGFVKGLAAPYLIYGSFASPAPQQVDIVRVPEAQHPDGALAADWSKIGLDVKSALAQYEETI